MIKFPCPWCGINISAEPQHAGISANCPTCDGELEVPSKSFGNSQADETATDEKGSQPEAPLARGSDAEASVSSPLEFPLSGIRTLAIGWLFFGWMLVWFLPDRYIFSQSILAMALPVSILGIPAVALAVIGILRFVRPERFHIRQSLGVMLFTMLVGLAGLLLFQGLAESSTHWATKNFGKANGFIYILKMIGWAYQSTNSLDITDRFFGFIFGVGLCEEFVKTIPILYFVFRDESNPGRTDFRSILILGFFSGLGFGIGEALYCYSPWTGNYSYASLVTRWFALVPFHAVYTVIDAAFLWLMAPFIRRLNGPYKITGGIALAISTMTILHGTYDVLFTIPYIGFALAIAALALMYFMVVFVAKKTSQAGRPSAFNPAMIKLPWSSIFPVRKGKLSFKRIYLITGFMILAVIPLSYSGEEFQKILNDRDNSETYSGLPQGYDEDSSDRKWGTGAGQEIPKGVLIVPSSYDSRWRD